MSLYRVISNHSHGFDVDVRVWVEAEVYPTESAEKVLYAVRRIFPEIGAEIKWLDGSALVKGYGEGLKVLERLKRLIKSRRIRAAARGILKASVQEGGLIFYLNKQAAYAGKAAFTEPYGESPLPPIKVRVETDNLEELISWLTE